MAELPACCRLEKKFKFFKYLLCWGCTNIIFVGLLNILKILFLVLKAPLQNVDKFKKKISSSAALVSQHCQQWAVWILRRYIIKFNRKDVGGIFFRLLFCCMTGIWICGDATASCPQHGLVTVVAPPPPSRLRNRTWISSYKWATALPDPLLSWTTCSSGVHRVPMNCILLVGYVFSLSDPHSYLDPAKNLNQDPEPSCFLTLFVLNL